MEREETYEEWKARLLTLSDAEISREIKDKILEKSGMDAETKAVFSDLYDYFSKQQKLGKPVTMDLLKIYLEEIKGYDTSKINMFAALELLSLCGFQFEGKNNQN